MKTLIIILILVSLFFIVTQENFDISGNLNLLTNTEARFDKPIRIPISADPDEDNEIPKQIEFDRKENVTILQKLKAINNILERIREISITNLRPGNRYVTTFNPALLPIQKFEPDYEKLKILNSVITDRLMFYSGNQYNLKIQNMDNTYGAETDDQYRIAYYLHGSIDDINIKIIIDLLILKSATTDTELNIIFTELRIDNPNIYITPYNDNNSNYELIGDYNKSLK
jgi:plasmid maintenance system killer protein